MTLTTVPLADVARRDATRSALTVNDVAMAIVAGALRTWLADAGELPDKPLVAAVPVAVGGKGAPHDRATASRCCSRRFRRIWPTRPSASTRSRDQMRDAKATHRDVGPQTLGALAECSAVERGRPAVPGVLGSRAREPAPAGSEPRGVERSGPAACPCTAAARDLVGLYPLGPIIDGAALNVTIVTCDDDVDIGIVTCPDVAPALGRCTRPRVPRALDELVALAAAHERPTDA